jgi:hypothetical protein
MFDVIVLVFNILLKQQRAFTRVKCRRLQPKKAPFKMANKGVGLVCPVEKCLSKDSVK